MISTTLHVFMFLAVFAYFTLLFYLLKKQTLNLKYTLLWIFSGVLMLMLSLFPKILILLAQFLGIYAPTNALFALIFFCVIIILMSLTAIVSKQNERIKQLAQKVALLDEQFRRQVERGTNGKKDETGKIER